MNIHLLLPKEPIDFVSPPREGEKDACPHCGERRITDCIYGVCTFLCGFSRKLDNEQPNGQVDVFGLIPRVNVIISNNLL